ncbi:MAG: hypothetical protein ACTHLN_04635 [Tepidisphaeraceae bacterium]
MPQRQPSSIEMANWLEPWFPLLARIGTAVERDVLSAIPILGLPRKTERANDFHRAWRNNFRRVCDLAPQFFDLVEEDDGGGLDYLLCKMNPDIPFGMRWGRYNGTTIRRNRTQRSGQFYEQGLLFACDEFDSTELPTVTLAHTIEDEYTIVGQSQMWMGRLYLLRERPIQSELVAEVHVYPEPDRAAETSSVPAPLVIAREDETEEWKRIIRDIRRSA